MVEKVALERVLSPVFGKERIMNELFKPMLPNTVLAFCLTKKKKEVNHEVWSKESNNRKSLRD